MSKQSSASTPMLQQITLQNLLSFGEQGVRLALRPLNLLIGPNGSGKSNLIEAIGVLRATTGDLRSMISKGGGITEWIWKGSPNQTAMIDVVVSNGGYSQPLRHAFSFRSEQQLLRIDDERIENESPYDNKREPYFYYRYQRGRPVVNVKGNERKLEQDQIDNTRSILAQRYDPDTYPEITYLADVYKEIRIYREWSFGRNSVFRQPQRADMRNDQLEEDFSNLGLFLNRLRRIPKAKQMILNALHDLYESLNDFDISVEGGTVQVFFTEGDFTIPATRLSDGTLRYLCLLAILCDPEPPPLICIEEPELGLHPDILPKVADLLKEASQRTQLIVTTHSDILVDGMTDCPESVVVCEKEKGQTTLQRLQTDDLQVWLAKYRLGQLWTRGQLGGTRW